MNSFDLFVAFSTFLPAMNCVVGTIFIVPLAAILAS